MVRITARLETEIFCNEDGGITIQQKIPNYEDAVVTFDYRDAPMIIEMINQAAIEAQGYEQQSENNGGQSSL